MGYEEYENPWTYVGVTEHATECFGTKVTVTALHYEDAETDYYLYGLLPTEDSFTNLPEGGFFMMEKISKADGTLVSQDMGMVNDGMSFGEKKAAVLEKADATKPSEEVEEKEEISEDETETEEKEETSEEKTEEKEPVKSEKVTYTVKAGDTMDIIATNFYGNNANRTRLYEYNKEAFKKTGGEFVVGMELVIPEELGGQKLIPAPEANDGEKLYVVKSGDTLWKIATAELGNGSLYTKIFDRNADRLEKATMIYVGQVLVIPGK